MHGAPYGGLDTLVRSIALHLSTFQSTSAAVMPAATAISTHSILNAQACSSVPTPGMLSIRLQQHNMVSGCHSVAG
jgi:hypothetical protein